MSAGSKHSNAHSLCSCHKIENLPKCLQFSFLINIPHCRCTKMKIELFGKGWLVMSKLKKIWQGLVGFGCNLAQLIAYLCRSYSLVGTQIQQRQQSKLGTLHFSPPGKSSLFGCKASNQKRPCLWWLSWLSCIWAGFHATMYHLA